jgi:transcription antitermination factor NusG
MRYEEYSLFEKGDRIKILYGSYEGLEGIVLEDQIDKDFYVKIMLNNGIEIREDSDCIDFTE